MPGRRCTWSSPFRGTRVRWWVVTPTADPCQIPGGVLDCGHAAAEPLRPMTPGDPPRTAAQRLRLSGLRLMGRLLARRPAGRPPAVAPAGDPARPSGRRPLHHPRAGPAAGLAARRAHHVPVRPLVGAAAGRQSPARRGVDLRFSLVRPASPARPVVTVCRLVRRGAAAARPALRRCPGLALRPLVGGLAGRAVGDPAPRRLRHRGVPALSDHGGAVPARPPRGAAEPGAGRGGPEVMGRDAGGCRRRTPAGGLSRAG